MPLEQKEKEVEPTGLIDERSVEFVLRHSETISLPSVKELFTPAQLVHPFRWRNNTTMFTQKCHWRDAYDAFQQELREQLWEQKSMLELVDDNVLYRSVRDKLFPLSVSGKQSRFFSNRAGHKLLETMEATGVWDELSQYSLVRKAGTLLVKKTSNGNKVTLSNNLNLQENNNATADMNIIYSNNSCDSKKTLKCAMKIKESNKKSALRKRLLARRKRIIVKNSLAFADICGGPGSFAEALLTMGKRYHLHWTGFGMTLANVEGLDWYNSLRRKRFVTTYGVDGSGDIFSLANIEALQSILHGYNVQLVVADGGFHVEPSLANFQETISSRILYAQWFVALRLLCNGGCFILKLFDTFAPLTRVILYLSTFLFRSVHIVKPKHSRVVNSERYLVCIDWQAEKNKVYFAQNPTHREFSDEDNVLKQESQQEEEEEEEEEIMQEVEEISWMSYLEYVYEYGFTDNDYIPDVIPPEWMARDQTFMDDLAHMNSVIANNQITALKMVMKELHQQMQSAKENKLNNETECTCTTDDSNNDNHNDDDDDDDDSFDEV